MKNKSWSWPCEEASGERRMLRALFMVHPWILEKIPSSNSYLIRERQLFILHLGLYYFSFFVQQPCKREWTDDGARLFVFILCFILIAYICFVWFAQPNYYILNSLDYLLISHIYSNQIGIRNSNHAPTHQINSHSLNSN